MLWGVFFRVMYGEWYGVCDFVVLSVVDVCLNYGGVNVFHVCLNFGVVYVRIPGGISQPHPVLSGVPQGTVLGALLLIIDIDKGIYLP